MFTGQYIRSVILDKPIDKESYLSDIPAVRHLAENKVLPFSRNVTFFVGENGTGKSTLIEAMAVAYGFNPEGGTRNFNFSTNQSHSDLWKHLVLAKRDFAKDGFFLRAESFYNVASNMEELDRDPVANGLGAPGVIDSYGGASLHKRSHGESFLALVQHRFGGNGVYILDEPEAALSPMRLMTLMVEIDRLVKQESQFIIATHSPILMAFPGAEILEFSEHGIRSVAYQDTAHYQVSRRFLDDPDRMLTYLLENNETR